MDNLLELIKARPVTTFTKPFEGPMFGFDRATEVVFGGERFPVAIKGPKGELWSGQRILIGGSDKSYLPGELKVGSRAIVTSFEDPHKEGVSDKIVQVLDEKSSELPGPFSVKPSNIAETVLPQQITGEPKEADLDVGGTKVTYLFASTIEAEKIHVMAVQCERQDNKVLFRIGDQVTVDEKGSLHYLAHIAGFRVGLNHLGSPEALIQVIHKDGAMVAMSMVNYNEATPFREK